jgi:phosphohistidine phosphatase SixA
MHHRKRMTIDEVWLAYHATRHRSSQLHARLVLAHAPTVKYLVARLMPAHVTADMCLPATGYIALSRAIADHDGLEADFKQKLIPAIRDAIEARIAEFF